jgi:hypothetical protein
MWLDARIPVHILAPESLAEALTADPDAAALVEAGVALPEGALAESFPAPPHPVGCTCCIARSVAAAAFDRLFLARVKGEVRFFTRVVAASSTAEGAAAIAAALADDPVVPMRYRAAVEANS